MKKWYLPLSVCVLAITATIGVCMGAFALGRMSRLARDAARHRTSSHVLRMSAENHAPDCPICSPLGRLVAHPPVNPVELRTESPPGPFTTERHR